MDVRLMECGIRSSFVHAIRTLKKIKMKKQIKPASPSGRKLNLNKRTISNLNLSDLNYKVGGLSGACTFTCTTCASFRNCGTLTCGTQTCAGQASCYKHGHTC